VSNKKVGLFQKPFFFFYSKMGQKVPLKKLEDFSQKNLFHFKNYIFRGNTNHALSGKCDTTALLM
jgi:hypothetical protein